MSNNDDAVGYGRPPKRTQFKSGQSGNPRGRPIGTARSQDRANIFWRVALEKLRLPTDSGAVKINRLEAFMRRLRSMMLNGDRDASNLLQKLRKHFPEPDPQSSDVVFLISEADAKL
jgi:hypothetical protein